MLAWIMPGSGSKKTVSAGSGEVALGFASRNLYASFLAALEAEKRADFDGYDPKAQIYNPHIRDHSKACDGVVHSKSARSLPLFYLQAIEVGQRSFGNFLVSDAPLEH